MAEPETHDQPNFRLPDPAEIGRSMADVAERSQRIVTEWLKRQTEEGPTSPDPLNIGSAFMEMTARLMANPAKLMQVQVGFWHDYMSLWQSTARRMMGMEAEPVIQADPKDRRFKDDAWSHSPFYDLLKQSYLLNSKQLSELVDQAQVDDKSKLQLRFYARQFIDAMSPSNFPATNPEVVRTAIRTRSASLAAGMQNLIEDIQKGRITRVDESAFEVGLNLAVTP